MKFRFCDCCGKVVHDWTDEPIPGKIIGVQYIDQDGSAQSRMIDLCMKCSRELQQKFVPERKANDFVLDENKNVLKIRGVYPPEEGKTVFQILTDFDGRGYYVGPVEFEEYKRNMWGISVFATEAEAKAKLMENFNIG